MRTAHPRYQCFPSVVCVGKETEVVILPRDISRIFRPERKYELAVVGLWEDQADYHAHLPLDHPCRVENGCLKFSHCFEKEQEYSIRFTENGGKEIRISLYAVEEDLYGLRPLKGDLHTHTFYSDGQDGLAMTPADYREEGYDFVAITDHNRMYPSELAAELYKGIPLGLHIMNGEEVHTPGSLVHIVHAGGKKSVCDRYIHDDAAYRKEVAEIAAGLEEVPEQYRERMAMAHWACRKIKEEKGLAILAHPFWCPNRYNESKEFLELLMDSKLFEAFEVIGGVGSDANNMQVALWREQALKGNKMAPIGSTDSHNHDFAREYFGRRFTYVFAKENSTEAILEAIRGGYSLAAELPATDENEARFYGDLRLVMYAHFLFKNYFNETHRLSVGEGILMRRYAEGEEVGDLLSALAPTLENHYKRFFGLEKVEGIPLSRRAFLDQALKMQQSGPETKGSNLFYYGGNERRE